MTFDEVRSQFPVLQRIAYLNAGTFGPLGKATVDAMRARHRADLRSGRFGTAYWEATDRLRTEARGRLAGLLQTDPALVALTSSTSDGCKIVAAGLGLSGDDEIVTTDSEHFGLLGPLFATGARVRVAEATADAILGAVRPRTKLLAVSHILWTTGEALPIRHLKDETGLPLLVDGAQSVGAVDVDVRGLDFYTVSGQKWLCGPDSTGALYVAEPERLRVAQPSYFAQEAYDPDGSYTPREGAARFDSGWIPPASLAGLVAAIDSAPDWRVKRTLASARACRVLLGERFQVVTPPGQSGLVSFRPNGDPAEVVARLERKRVVVREIPGRGLIRASCGYWTSDGDLERLLAALG
jgi:L-cysteine/cystine lyase